MLYFYHQISNQLKRFLIIALFLLCCHFAWAQGEDALHDDRIHIFGYVVTSDSLFPVRNTHVISKMAHCGTISNRNGEFFVPTKKVDTLWVSCVGYSRRLIPVDSTMAGNDTLLIRLTHDTITLKEVNIKPYYDYNTFKEMVINMPTIPLPREIQRLNEDLNDYWTRHPKVNNNGMPTVTASPLQFLYDKYNAKARRQARILRNRRMFNEVLREQGRTDELLPDSLDYSVDYRIYDFGDEEDKKPEKKKSEKKYIRLGE